MKGIMFATTKGGAGKTCLCHVLALGAAWKGVPAHLMHTDNRKPLVVRGRPYMYYDARDLETLTRIMGAAVNSDGLCIIDSGGNRPDFDKWLVSSIDMVILPVTPDDEAVDMAKEHMKLLENHGAKNVRFLLNMVSSNRFENVLDYEDYFKRLDKNKIIGQVLKVAAVKRLKKPDVEPFGTPPTKVNNLARGLFSTVMRAFENIDRYTQKIKVA